MRPVLLFLAASTTLAQSMGGGVNVQLSLAGGRSIYRSGEPIRMILSFTADAPGYNLNTTTTQPASPVDDVTISPDSGVFHWLDDYSRRGRYSPDYAGMTRLSDEPSTVELTLNDWFRFDQPGHYTVSITTRRVSKPARARDPWGEPISLTTNDVSFEVTPMSDAEEQAEIQGGDPELLYLTGDPSTREKVRRYLKSEGDPLGLYIARNRALVIQLLEDALYDPKRPVTGGLLSTLGRLRSLQDDEADPRKSERGYIERLAASLPKRTGESRTTTAITILTWVTHEHSSGDPLSASMRDILKQQFEALPASQQEYLLRAHWVLLREPSLVPAIEQLLRPNGGADQFSTRAIMLERLMDLAPGEARPFVLAEIRDSTSMVDFNVLRSLPDEALPEADAALLDQIRALAPGKQPRDAIRLAHKTKLAARYATPAIHDQLMESYRAFGQKWDAEARGGLLSYFARYKDKEATPLIEEALTTIPSGQRWAFFDSLASAYYSPEIDALMRRNLASEDAQTASQGAYLMSRHGSEADARFIEARLDKWLERWGGQDDPPDPMLQVNLIQAMVQAKSWKLSRAETEGHWKSCVSKACAPYVTANAAAQ
jgi:hypothetical protein